MNTAPISRRHALGLLGAGVATVAAGAAGWVRGAGGHSGVTGAELAEPATLTSAGGLLDVRLTAAPGVRLAGRATSAWGYNGTSPGPTLHVRPGDLLRIHLVNHLPQATNLHTHGLHVSPQGAGDNPFVTVEPGGRFDYAIRIPADHPAGTFWYHPHHHGQVADQIFAGLAGALIVDGGPDLAVRADRVLLVTDTTLDAAGDVTGQAATPMGREGDLVLVNGHDRPVVTAGAGTTERWRVINGCTSRVLALRLTGHLLTQLAGDGVFLPSAVDRERIVLAPGNRADFLVRPAGPGAWPLIAEPYDRGSAMMGGMGAGGPASATAALVLATLKVGGTGPAATTALPPLPTPAVPAGAVTVRRRLTLAMGMGMGMGNNAMSFTIDGRTFDADRDDQTVALGSVEEWTVDNTTTMDHPFHLHAWPFQVVATSAGDAPGPVRQDVVLVPAGGWARLRIAFTDFTGRSVYHCHILDHEDRGMMGVVNVGIP